MSRSGAISIRAFTVLVIFFMVGTSILIAPAGLAADAKQDAWLACIAGVLFNAFVVLLYGYLGRKLGSLTLVEYCRKTLGTWAGGAVALGFVGFFYLLAALMVGDMGYFLTTQTIPETPIEIVQILFALALIGAVRAGLGVFTRAAEIFFPWMIILFLILIIPVIPKFELSGFTPMLEYGVKPVMKGAFKFYGLQEMVVLLMIYPYVVHERGRGRAFFFGVLIGGCFLIVTTVGSIAVLGPSLTANQLFPAYTLAKNINIGQFLQRVEGMMIFIWVLSIFLKISITLHASVLGFGQLLGFKDYRPLTVPLAFGLIVLSLMCYPNTLFIQEFLAKNWSPFNLIFTLFLPLLLLAVSWLRRKSADHPLSQK
ncbi:Spore germination protein YndE [Paenibacillus konkukensis]|uniref:Spore germination protein YndE n=1 Tax=Paenibacillus konkukensis TaxID=2020716 RepID=A0ABY4RUK6_9BACL|nr:endospore germination permease [Paenibacillus konkukensis]UQZ85102.1 Spore germination protein YndE [Paenibacillus konkukensis]